MVGLIEEGDLIRRVSGLTRTELEICVSAGWVLPAQTSPPQRRYDEADVARLTLIHELRHDLGFDDEAVPVVLSLIDQIHSLRYALHAVAEALKEQPEERRQPVLDALLRKLGD